MDEVLKIASIRECCSFGMGAYDSVDCKKQRGSIKRFDKLDERIQVEYNLSSIPAVKRRPIELPEWAT